jgi:hypothetical protein
MSNLDYNYAKVKLVNNYLEVFEHTVDLEKATELVHIIVNIIRAKPIFDLSDKYFSKSYSLAIQSLDLQSSLVEESIQHTIASHREWMKRYAIISGIKDLDTDNPTKGYKTVGNFPARKEDYSTFSSFLELGLPRAAAPNSLSQPIIMHNPGILVDITGKYYLNLEIVPACENIIKIDKHFKELTNDLIRETEEISKCNNISRLTVECIILKTMKVFAYGNCRNIGIRCVTARLPRLFAKEKIKTLFNYITTKILKILIFLIIF